MDIGIIGGADGPTSILLARSANRFFFDGGFEIVFLLMLALVIGVFAWTVGKPRSERVIPVPRVLSHDEAGHPPTEETHPEVSIY